MVGGATVLAVGDLDKYVSPNWRYWEVLGSNLNIWHWHFKKGISPWPRWNTCPIE